jgi:hypothetical protein
MEIHVNNQTAGVITYIDGNQVVYGGLHGTVVTDEDARRAVHELREALPGAALDRTRATEARARIAEVAEAVRGPRPDKRRAGDALRRFTELLARAGSLVTASSALLGPLQILATWLGVHGAAIASLLAL